MGLFGSSQTTDGSTTSTNTQTASNTAQNSNQSASTSTPTMDPLFTMFQQSLVPAFGQAYAQAQTPVYGTNQIAQVAQGANDTFNNGMSSATQALARRGALNSGAASSIASSLGNARAGSITNFENQIPFLNEQAQTQNTDSLLNLANQFMSTVPKGVSNTGTSSGQSSGSSNQFGLGSGTSNSTTTSSPSILSDIGSIAGILGSLGLGNLFGSKDHGNGDFGGET